MIALAHDDPRFPRALDLVEKPPRVLYAIGDPSLLQRPAVSIIGSRHPSDYGHRVAYEAARALAGQGLVVVSGMARGLDARAHRGALDAGGGTIAVLGSAIDVAYPKSNAALYDEIGAKGLVLSEYPPGTEWRNWNFPARNRIIAALGRCLLVVEGKAKGGTSNTAEWALRTNGTIFAVPGRIGDLQAEGPNALIQGGALIYTRPNDILAKLGLPLLPEPRDDAKGLRARLRAAREARAGLNGAEATLFDLMSPEPVHVDALATKSAIEPGLLLAALSSLELQGLIAQLPGKHFKLAS